MRFRRALAAAMLGSICALAQQVTDARRNFDEARRLFERRQWDDARKLAMKALAADPQMGDAEILLGLIATVRSQFAGAEQRFARAVQLQPGNYQAHAYLGSTYLQEKRLPEAAAEFRRVLELNPRNTAALYNLGLIGLERGAPAEALRYFEAVTQATPSDVPAWIGSLESLLLLGRKPAAREAAGRLQSLLPESDPRLLQVGTLLARYGDSTSAIPLIEQARRAYPNSYDVNYNLALACLQAGQYDRAAEVLKPFAGDSGKPEAFDLLGAIEEKRGRPAEAEKAFEAAARRESATENYAFDYANSLAQHGRLEPAFAAFQAGLARLPGSWKLRLGLGSVCYLRGDYPRAAEALLEAVRLQPRAAPAYFLLGELYEAGGRFQPAIEAALASYLKTSPRDPWAYYHYAAILSAHAQADGNRGYRDALANLDRALSLDANFAEAYFERGVIALAQGRAQQAIASFERCVKLEPGLAAAHYRLGLAYQRLGEAERARSELARFRELKKEGYYRGRVLASLSSLER